MLPKPMRGLEKDEVKWFIEVDERPITESEIREARHSFTVYRKIKPRA